MNFKMIVILMLLALAALFIIQNVAMVEIQFLFWSMQMSRSMLIFMLLVIGVVIGWFLHSYIKFRDN